jgi:hypothetical protein
MLIYLLSDILPDQGVRTAFDEKVTFAFLRFYGFIPEGAEIFFKLG